MNYKVINDEVKLKEFIEWLPELESHEKYYVTLFARKKYDDTLKGDKAQLKRFVAHKGNMFDKIKQLECEVGSYKIDGKSVSQKGLSLYITPSPRSLEKATAVMIKKCVDMLLKKTNFNIQAEALTCIQKSKSRTVFMDFDIDVKDANIAAFKDVFPANSYHIIQTRGGYHLLMRPDKQGQVDWYKEIYRVGVLNSFNIDQTGDQLLPVPGSYQGGFTPKLLY